MKILLLNGPNLNLLGKREPEIYGKRSLQDIIDDLVLVGQSLSCEIEHFQSNSEAALIDKLHTLFAVDNKRVDAIIINPAAFTHTSIALRDAILAVNKPFIEVHLSNVHAREAFRHQSFFSDIAQGVIVGLGEQGYEYALRSLVSSLSRD